MVTSRLMAENEPFYLFTDFIRPIAVKIVPTASTAIMEF